MAGPFHEGDQGGQFHTDESTFVDIRLREPTAVKNPLIQAVVESGWTFAPIVTFFRPLGG
jgi:hypothetical protein